MRDFFKKFNSPWIRQDISCVVAVGLFFLMLACGYCMKIFDIFGTNQPKMPENPSASELFVLLEHQECNSAYLGTYFVKDFGEIVIFCENGQYFGEIHDSFSITMTEMKQKGYFNAIFCLESNCYAHPVYIDNNVLQDVYGKYVFMEGLP